MATSVAKVVGANVRSIRLNAGVTLDRLAFTMRLCGLRWSTGRIGSLESGHIPARIETLYVVALALGRATHRPVSLSDLLDGSAAVTLNDELGVDLTALRDAVSGKPVTVGETAAAHKLDERLRPVMREATEALGRRVVRESFREADYRVCRKLGVSPEDGLAAMLDLWGPRTFSEQRDHLAGAGANAQRRGNVSRQLQAELQKVLSDGHD